MFRIVAPLKLTTLDACDSVGVQVEHDFVMRLQRLAEPREVEHDGAICHGNRPPSGCPIAMAAERCSRECVLRSTRSSLIWADARDRTDAAEIRLRQVYAELGGMIGDSHKSERRMLLRKIMDKVRVGA